LQSHGKIDECIKYAEIIERYDTVIVHYINKQEHEKALQKVTEIKDEVKRNETMLQYASIFLNKCAKPTIQELQR
jgi:membrane-bound lytic murein transglycosylase MltF